MLCWHLEETMQTRGVCLPLLLPAWSALHCTWLHSTVWESVCQSRAWYAMLGKKVPGQCSSWNLWSFPQGWTMGTGTSPSVDTIFPMRRCEMSTSFACAGHVFELCILWVPVVASYVSTSSNLESAGRLLTSLAVSIMELLGMLIWGRKSVCGYILLHPMEWGTGLNKRELRRNWGSHLPSLLPAALWGVLFCSLSQNKSSVSHIASDTAREATDTMPHLIYACYSIWHHIGPKR